MPAPVDVEEVKGLIEEQGKLFHEYKKINDMLQAEAKRLGAEDALTKAAVEKLDAALHDIEAKLNRPGMFRDVDDGPSDDGTELKSFNLYLPDGRKIKTREEYDQYQKSFWKNFRRGREALDATESKALSAGNDPGGGFFLPSATVGRIITKVNDESPIRQLSGQITISSDKLEGMADRDDLDSGWVGEMSERSETDTPTLGMYVIEVHEQYAQPKITQRFLDDSAVDVEAWLIGKLVRKFAMQEGAAFVTGNGILKPRGFTTYPTTQTGDATRKWGEIEHIATGSNGGFAATNPADRLFDLIAAFKPSYLQGASWITRREVVSKVRQFKDGTGGYLWQPSLAAGQPSRLLDYPVAICQDMPAMATGSLSTALSNLKRAYQIVDRIGITLLRDPYTQKGYVKLYSTKRVGGAVVDFDAIKFLKFLA